MATRSEWIIDKTEAVGTEGMVTAMQPLAAEAGAEILKRGGNAIDAAVAIAFAIGVVEPFMSGVGGIAFLVYRDAKTGETICFDGSAILPRAITPEHFELLAPDQRGGMYGWRATKGDANNTGWLTPGVPGTPDLLWQAHQRFGSLPWAELLQPAIGLAEEGFDVNHYISLMMSANYERLSLFPESRKTFIKPSGAPYVPSGGGKAEGGRDADLLRQPDLARTLKLIASEGAETVYRGEIARMIADDMAANGGLITMEDLAAHETVIREPGSITYRGHQILAQLENTGNPTVLEALQILEGFDLSSLEYQSPEAVHLIVEAMRRSFTDRLRHLGDAALMDVPMAGLLSTDYAAERRATIDPGKATPDATHGDPWPFDPASGKVAERSGSIADGNTTHINVIDKDRNMVSLTSTLGQLFGSGVVIKGTGITLNNATTWFDPEPGAVASIGPGKRTMSAASPILVLKDGAPYATIGSPGGRRVITAIYQIVVNLLDFGLGVQASISAPRTHTEGPATEISTRFPAATIEGLEKMGHKVVRREDTLAATHFARPSGIVVDGDELRAGVHPWTPATSVGI
jgi:gamma-glutamyltranspeptidase / glutathione hydrolase